MQAPSLLLLLAACPTAQMLQVSGNSQLDFPIVCLIHIATTLFLLTENNWLMSSV